MQLYILYYIFVYVRYDIQQSSIRNHNGWGLLKSHYNASLSTALSIVYPEYDWQAWKFSRRARNYWDASVSHRRQYFDVLGREMKLERMEDWRRVTVDEVNQR